MNFLRQLEIVPPEVLARLPVHILGAGGVGSTIAFALAKMGIGDLTVYDSLVVDEATARDGWYRRADLGRQRVEALSEIIDDYTGVKLRGIGQPAEDQSFSGVVIQTLDNSEICARVWQKAIKLNGRLDLAIMVSRRSDRLSLVSLRPFDPDEIDWYEERLLGETEPYSLAIPFFAGLDVAAEVGKLIKLLVTTGEVPRELFLPLGMLEDIPRARRQPVKMIGAGGIGSFSSLALAKLGHPLTVFDHDTVEPHNLPTQCFRLVDVGRPKVEALRDTILAFTDLKIEARQERFVRQSVAGPMISGVDSMDTRLEIWHGLVKGCPEIPIYLDGRMGAETLYLYAVRPADAGDIQWYEGRLYPSSQAAPAPCSARAIVYTLLGMAGEVARQMTRLAAGTALPREIVREMRTSFSQVDGQYHYRTETGGR